MGYDIDINYPDECGTTALMKAVANENIDIITLLLEHDANVNSVDCHGDTALMEAARKGNIDCAKLLLSTGKIDNINKLNNYGTSALLHARGYCEFVELLVHSGADVNCS